MTRHRPDSEQAPAAAQSSPHNPETLHYSPTPPWHRRRRTRRVLAASLFLAAGTIVIWQRPPITSALRMHFYQRACLTFDNPSGHVALEFDPDPAQSLVSSSRDYVTDGSISWPALFTPPQAQRFLGGRAIPPEAVAFLHKRTSPGGNSATVVVQIGGPVIDWDAVTGMCSTAYIRAASVPLLDLWNPWPNQQGYFVASVILTRNFDLTTSPPNIIFDHRTRFFSGHPDPSDSSRFTIEYVTGGLPDTIDGQLLDDYSVQLKPRRARVTRRAMTDIQCVYWDNLPTDPDSITSRPTSSPYRSGILALSMKSTTRSIR